jgi:hypothetical protein
MFKEKLNIESYKTDNKCIDANNHTGIEGGGKNKLSELAPESRI